MAIVDVSVSDATAQPSSILPSSNSGSMKPTTPEMTAQATVVIRPALVRTNMLDFERKLQHLAAGEDAARELVPALSRAIARFDTRQAVEASGHQ